MVSKLPCFTSCDTHLVGTVRFEGIPHNPYVSICNIPCCLLYTTSVAGHLITSVLFFLGSPYSRQLAVSMYLTVVPSLLKTVSLVRDVCGCSLPSRAQFSHHTKLDVSSVAARNQGLGGWTRTWLRR
jgi:hypothetical protein